MAGLGRIQQRFNAAVVMVLALAGFGGLAGQSGARKAAVAGGQPIARKYIKSSNPRSNTPGTRYEGYCSGLRYRAHGGGKLRGAVTPGMTRATSLPRNIDRNDNAAVRRALGR